MDISVKSPLTNELLHAYYHSGRLDKALKICQTLRQKYGVLNTISAMEAAIYEEIGDLSNAKQIALEYLRLYPEHFGMRLLVAVVNSRTGEIEELDRFLRSATYTDIETLPWEFGIRLAQLYTERHQHRKAIELLYELRRRFSEQRAIHLRYIQAFTFVKENDDTEWLLPSKVRIDTAILLQKPLGESEWYFILDDQDAGILRKEFSPDHPIGQKLLDRKIGDEIVLKESAYSTETATITEIKSKYIHALHETLESFETFFPGASDFWSGRFASDETEEEKQKSLQPIFDIISLQHEISLQIEHWYNGGRLTLGTFAELTGENVIGIWAKLTGKPDVGIKCCFGTAEERNVALSGLEGKPKLIADIISILTVHHIQAGDMIVKAYGKFGIAQATVDLLQQAIRLREGRESEGFSTLGKEGEHFVLGKVPPEDVQRGLEYLKRLKKWIEDNCEVLPCNAALHIRRSRRKELEETIGKAFVDTILIASEPGRILYSDDERLRALAKSEHNVDGVWTQVLLMNCANNLLEKKRYHEMIIKLVTSHYYYTTINSEILIEAAKQADWSPSEPYTTVVQILRGGSSDEDSALSVGTNFLFELWKQDIWKQQPEHRDTLIQNLLKAITTARKSERVLERLKAHVKGRFKYLPFQEREILSLIDTWRRTHIT